MTNALKKSKPYDAPEIAVADVRYGPAMHALTDRQRKYVEALFLAPKSYGSGVFAVKLAGYGSATSSKASLASMAYQLNSDPKVQAAIAEMSQQYLTTLGPVAVRAMKKVLGNDKHREFGRVLGILMDRVAPANSTHTVKVEHEASSSMRNTAEVFEKIMALAARAKVSPMIDVTPQKEAS